ncbi:hypothetical protein ACIO93_24625 [Streptomyces sp. NPDC087903]|uniref:hypothetical protein n=1 Tax=Streptomyces sp. NPDC087903 TaxID=3365819 RepID=UPI0037F46288
MDEKALQDLLAASISAGDFPANVSGWDRAEARISAAESPLLEENIPVDFLIIQKVATSALSVREALWDLEPVSSSTRSISLDPADRLYPDLLYTSAETGSVVVFELKRARATARETVTELMAYEQEVRNHLPFSARTDICFIVVSTDYSALLNHSLTSLIAWHDFRVLCLKADPDDGSLSLHLPYGWSGLGQDVIPAEFLDTINILFTPHEAVMQEGEGFIGEIMDSALEIVSRDAEKGGITGFGFSWRDFSYPHMSEAPAALTVARVNAARFMQSGLASPFLEETITSPLLEHIKDQINEFWGGSNPEIRAGLRYLKGFGAVTVDGSATWWNFRSEHRHRWETCYDWQVVPDSFRSWGFIGQYCRDLLSNPARSSNFYAGAPRSRINCPDTNLRILERITPAQPDVKPLGSAYFARLGYRMSRLLHLAQIYESLGQAGRRGVFPSLYWARVDASSALLDLQVALHNLQRQPPDIRVKVGFGPNIELVEDPAQIKEFCHQLARDVISVGDSPLVESFTSCFNYAPVLDLLLSEALSRERVREQSAALLIDARKQLSTAVHRAQESGLEERVNSLLAERLGMAASDLESHSDTLEAIENLTGEKLFSQFTTGIRGVVDLTCRPLSPAKPLSAITLFDIERLRAQIEYLRNSGRNATIVIEPTGYYGVRVVSDEHESGALELNADQVLVAKPFDGVEMYVRYTWNELEAEIEDSRGEEA